ncbi:hypothetical protein EMN47_11105 [Prolixibacteraceae bacterium JC049]|nr:hypothetical protein [Prolixibacteraceae bacterium JC049]
MRTFYLITLLLFVFGSSNAIKTKQSKYVGMPVGGICAGQVYLGADGQLWYWDIFNIAAINPGNEGGHRFYVNPLAQKKTFENGFGLKVKDGDKTFFRPLNYDGFSNVEFTGSYPVGNVKYSDETMPVNASLKAFSPFIPTDADNSGLPVTVLEYTIQNTSDRTVGVELHGWLQNMVGFQSGKGKAGMHVNRIEKLGDKTRLICEGSGDYQEKLPDWGSMSLTLLGKGEGSARASHHNGLPLYFSEKENKKSEAELGNKLVGSISGKESLKPGERKTFTFLLSWYFPNIHLWNGAHHWKNIKNLRFYYTKMFKNAAHVTDYVADNKWLIDDTKQWEKTWNDSSLPKWFLDRTFLNVSTLATSACVRFNDLTDDPDNEGRFYTMEGVYLGHGTCTHVFHYEQALGRVFPNLARQLREQIDLGLSFKENGIIQYRSAEYTKYGQQDGRDYAIDGHAGTVMRIYREHLMAPDSRFLKENWSKIKKSIQYMIDHDSEKTGKPDGILEGIQYNTLDRMWYGKISWISGLYAASLKAGEKMAKEVGDKSFAKKCAKIAALSYANISKELFNGEYFIQKLDPEHLDAPNSNIGCHTDQLLGQYWSTQVGLGDILPNDKVKTALKSIMKYNYVDNYGKYLGSAKIPIKRWYADDDEAGVIMCTFPKGGTDKAPGKIRNEWEKLVVGYFSEVWTGQEHQLAAALIEEGMVEDGMKVVKAVHDRYDAKRRNPYNEIEYGNHYTRAMSGYAPFVAASGFTYNGPAGVIGFSPKIDSKEFKSAFISASGWGKFDQKVVAKKQTSSIAITFGELKLKQINLKPELEGINSVDVFLNGKKLKSKFKLKEKGLQVSFNEQQLKGKDQLVVTIQ